MRTFTTRSWALGIGGLVLAGLSGCATPAVVFVSPDYNAQQIKRVSVEAFSDAPGQQGSGATMSDVFEKYLFNLKYEIVDPSQAQADAIITGSISELTDTSEQTVLVDVPQEVTTPVYQDVVVQGRRGQFAVNEQVGTQTTETDQSVPETEVLPARAGLNVRMVSAKSGELLWSGSASADGMDISSAAEAVASKIVDALQKELTNLKPSPAH
jgi:hypothetical protein